MSVCPNEECGQELTELDEDVIGNTDEIQGEQNARAYTCPACKSHIVVYIKVDTIALSEEEVDE